MTPAARLVWVRMYERTGDAGMTCRRCGVSRPTLRKWWRRYVASAAGLVDRSRCPLRSPGRRVLAGEEQRILTLRSDRKLGIKRLRNELIRLDGLRLSVDTIHKVLCRHGLNRLKRPRLVRKGRKRYSRPIPGDRVQMDVCKIGPRLYGHVRQWGVNSGCRGDDLGHAASVPGMSGWGRSVGASSSAMPSICM